MSQYAYPGIPGTSLSRAQMMPVSDRSLDKKVEDQTGRFPKKFSVQAADIEMKKRRNLTGALTRAICCMSALAFIQPHQTASAQSGARYRPLAGIRQGTSLWLTKNGAGTGSLKLPPAQHFSWNKEIFFRTASQGHWLGEAGFQHYSLRSEEREGGAVRYKTKTQFLQLNLSAQYDVSYPLLGYLVPYFFKMRSFAGISISPRLALTQLTPTASSDAPHARTQSSVMVGVSYSHTLPIGKRWYATSAFSYRSVPFSRFRQDKDDFGNPNRAFSWAGGICYQL